MVTGKNMITLKNWNEVLGDFATRFLVDDESANKGTPRLKLSQVYAVSRLSYLLFWEWRELIT